MNRLCVAISRARCGLYLFGNHAHLAKASKKGWKVRWFIAWLKFSLPVCKQGASRPPAAAPPPAGAAAAAAGPPPPPPLPPPPR